MTTCSLARVNTSLDVSARASSRSACGVVPEFRSRRDRHLTNEPRGPKHRSRPSASRSRNCAARANADRNIAETFFAGGGLKKTEMSDSDQAKLLAAVAKHLLVLQQIPDFLPHLHVEYDAVEVRDSKICDGRGVFATRAIPAYTLVTTYPATNEVSLMSGSGDGDGNSINDESRKVHTWRAPTYKSSQPRYAMCNGHMYFGENGLRIEADPDGDPQPGFLGHLINDVLMPPTDGKDVEYAHSYLTKTTNETNCHAVPFPSGMVAIATSHAIEKDEELTMSYTFGYDEQFMKDVRADPELNKKLLTNAFAADMKVSSAKMEQLTTETMKRHAQAELLSRELLVDAAEEE